MPLPRRVPLKARNPKRWREIKENPNTGTPKPDKPQEKWVCIHPDCTIFLAGHRMNLDLTFDSKADLDWHKSRAHHWTDDELQEQRGLLPGTETEEDDDDGKGKRMVKGKETEAGRNGMERKGDGD